MKAVTARGRVWSYCRQKGCPKAIHWPHGHSLLNMAGRTYRARPRRWISYPGAQHSPILTRRERTDATLADTGQCTRWRR